MKYFKNQKCDFIYPVITMGTFDGVHLGHQKLLQELKSKAREHGGEAVVITYYHHPLETIHKSTFPYLLTEKEKKEELLKMYGVDCVLYLDFSENMVNISAEDFLCNIIIGEVKAKAIVIGYDTHFGKNRSGDFQFLKENSRNYNYEIDIIEPYKIDNRIISSSLIRDLVREGDMQYVSELLGRNYSASGVVKTGHRIGHGLGFPTINLHPADNHKLVPGIGVYICEVEFLGSRYKAVTNVGYSPTLKNTGIKEIETHILDFKGDLYNTPVEIFFHKKLRNELHFENKDKLIGMIEKDIKLTKEYFGE
ncbi:MAG: bifunctional riboflavin kinase/FAD synthetase [Candidatus Cloacimonetes bacterium]|nr:bifunctional riboflavin kinase/FAD synthetase [Candidatus Cloacimonadota bacterium]